MQTWSWNNLRFALPDDWEMLQFSRNPEAGRCAFADRYQYRFEINWQVIGGPPDFQRMVGDYQAKLATDGVKDLRPVQHAPWYGVYGMDHDTPVSRYGAFFPLGSLLLEVVFLFPVGDKPNHALEGRLLDQIQVVEPDDNGLLRWKAFGLDALVSAEHPLALCQVHTAHVTMSFHDKEGHVQETMGRHGMVDCWLDIPLVNWLDAQIPRDYSIILRQNEINHGHQVFHVVARRRRPVLKDWLWGTRHMEAYAWICPADGRLRFMSRTAPQSPKRPLPPFLLCCCPDHEVSL